jgi:hypothetical protein
MMMKKYQLLRATAFVCLTCLFIPVSAHAINCFSSDEEEIAKMYDIYVRAGKEPHVKEPIVTAVEPAVTMYGEVIGLKNYEECWFERPSCKKPADYAPVRVDAAISYDSLNKQYNRSTKDVIYECFMKIGASYKYKTRYNQRR